jgi:hypothetical protein
MEAIDGARYSFRRSELLMIAKIIRTFKMAPPILATVAVIHAIIDSVSEYERLGSEELSTKDVEVGSHLIQQLS